MAAADRLGNFGLIRVAVSTLFFIRDCFFHSVYFLYKFDIFKKWITGRKYFKLLRWTIGSIDAFRKFEDKDSIAVVKYFPSPMAFVYNQSFWIYPDNDSNIARLGTILSGINLVEDDSMGLKSKITFVVDFKSKMTFITSVVALSIEQVRDKVMTELIADAHQSYIPGECSFNITNVTKAEINEFSLHSAWWYMLWHSAGERIINPILFSEGEFDNDLALATSAVYMMQDYKKFQFILRDARDIINYLDDHPGCVVDVETPKPKHQTIDFNPLPERFEHAIPVQSDVSRHESKTNAGKVTSINHRTHMVDAVLGSKEEMGASNEFVDDMYEADN